MAAHADTASGTSSAGGRRPPRVRVLGSLAALLAATACSAAGGGGEGTGQEEPPPRPLEVSEPVVLDLGLDPLSVGAVATVNDGELLLVAGDPLPGADSPADSVVVAVDDRGAEVWRTRDVAARTDGWVTAASPALVAFATDGGSSVSDPFAVPPASDLVGLDPGTGRQLWRTPGYRYDGGGRYADGLAYSLAPVPDAPEEFLVVGRQRGGSETAGESGGTVRPIGLLAALSAEDGRLLWSTGDSGSMGISVYDRSPDGTFWVGAGCGEFGCEFVRISTETGSASPAYGDRSVSDLDPIESVSDLEITGPDTFRLTLDGVPHEFEALSWGATGEGSAGGTVRLVGADTGSARSVPVPVESVLPDSLELFGIGDSGIRIAVPAPSPSAAAEGERVERVTAVGPDGEVLWERTPPELGEVYVYGTPEAVSSLQLSGRVAFSGEPLVLELSGSFGTEEAAGEAPDGETVLSVVDGGSGETLWSRPDTTPLLFRGMAETWQAAGLHFLLVREQGALRYTGVDLLTGEEYLSHPFTVRLEAGGFPEVWTRGRFLLLVHEGSVTMFTVPRR